MSYKPTNEDLTAYLYGELDESSKAQIDQYLKEHPEARAELESVEETRMVMSQWEDEEVPMIPGFMQPHENSEWLYWRKYVAIAASLLLLFTFGKISGFKMNYNESGFYMGFGEIKEGLSIEEVNEMLLADRQQMMDLINNDIETVRNDVDNDISTIQAALDNNVNHKPEFNPLSDEQIEDLLNRQKKDIIQQMVQLSANLTDEYRGVFKELYTNFADNLEAKRIDDFNNIQNALSNLENATIDRQEEIENAIFDLSREVNEIIETQSNNNNNN